jgi:hypothetical protein
VRGAFQDLTFRDVGNKFPFELLGWGFEALSAELGSSIPEDFVERIGEEEARVRKMIETSKGTSSTFRFEVSCVLGSMNRAEAVINHLLEARKEILLAIPASIIGQFVERRIEGIMRSARFFLDEGKGSSAVYLWYLCYSFFRGNVSLLYVRDLREQNLLTLLPENELEDWMEKFVRKERWIEVKGQGAGFMFRVKIVRRIKDLAAIFKGGEPRPHFMSGLRVFFFHLLLLYYLDAAERLGEARWIDHEGGWPGTLQFYQESSLRPIFESGNNRLNACEGKLPDDERMCGRKKMRQRDCKQLQLKEWDDSFDLLSLFTNDRDSPQSNMYRKYIGSFDPREEKQGKALRSLLSDQGLCVLKPGGNDRLSKDLGVFYHVPGTRLNHPCSYTPLSGWRSRCKKTQTSRGEIWARVTSSTSSRPRSGRKRR